MARRKPKLDSEDFEALRQAANEWDTWDRLKKSEFGPFLLAWLDRAILETLDTEDRTDIYTMDQQAREYFFSSVRSKRQTLKAIRDKLVNAEAEKAWRANELAKVQPE